ncbi:unnamed protein product, partial [Staurois parvus]
MVAPVVIPCAPPGITRPTFRTPQMSCPATEDSGICRAGIDVISRHTEKESRNLTR